MYPKGTIYDSTELSVSDFKHGEIIHKYRETSLRPSSGKKLGYFFARSIGAGFLAFGVVSAIFALSPLIGEEINYRFGPKQESISESKFAEMVDVIEAQEKERVMQEANALGINAYFSVNIPSIDASANITPNVNAGSEDEYLEALQSGVAHAAGSYFPGQGKNIFLFAHSTDTPLNYTRFNAVFYLLRKLNVGSKDIEGDRITVYFADTKHVYEVEQIVTVGADETEWMTKDYGGERLILQTCSPPGTTWQRLLVIAKKVE